MVATPEGIAGSGGVGAVAVAVTAVSAATAGTGEVAASDPGERIREAAQGAAAEVQVETEAVVRVVAAKAAADLEAEARVPGQ